MADKLNKRDVPALSCRAAVGAVSDEKRTVDVVFTTGAKVLRDSFWDGPFYEELSLDPKHVRMGRLNSGAPFLPDHNGSKVASVLGVVESARIENGQGIATVRFAKPEDDPEADKVYRKIKDGIIKNVSVGYRIHRFEEVAGGDSAIPTLRATDWEPYEISAVAMGADAGAGFRSESTERNSCEFLTRGAAAITGKTMTAEELAAAEAKRVEEIKVAAEAAATAELARVTEIRSACRVAKLEDSFADKLCSDRVSVEKARSEMFKEMARKSNELAPAQGAQIRAVVTDDSRDKFYRGVSAWLFEKAGNHLVEKAVERKAKGFEKVSLDGGEFRGMTLMDVVRECLERSGVSTRGIYSRDELIKRAATTTDFPVLFENVMHKQMLAAYAVQSDTWRGWCGTESVSDFREANRFRKGSFGTLPVVAENGEYLNQEIPDGSKIAISTEKRGGIIGLSWEALVNDDMGALVNLAVEFGRSAGLSIEVAAYALLALNSGAGPTLGDSHPFFYSGRGNIGSSAALTVASLDADRVLMRKQLDDSSNEYLDLNPRILLIPVELESTAKMLNASTLDPTSSAALNKPNVVQGMFGSIVSSPRMPNTTRRYMFTDGKEAFKVAFLAETGEGPVIESQAGFRTDGIEWKAKIVFKVNPFDPKTALTNAGT